MLPLSPAGDRWSFQAPARCMACREPISKPMVAGEIYYLEYPESLVLGRAGSPSHLDDILASRPSI